MCPLMPNDIAKKAFIDAQILLDPRLRHQRKKVARELEKTYHIPSGTLGDADFREVRVLSLLYLLVVYPKELWNLQPTDPKLSDLTGVFDLDSLSIDWGRRSFDGYDHYEFIHRIRNAVSHANVSFTFESVTLTDRNGFIVSLSTDQMSSFLSNVGAFLANFTPVRTH